MLLFPFFSNGSFPVQNYESQRLSVKTNNQMINFVIICSSCRSCTIFYLKTKGKNRGRGMAIAGLSLGLLTLLIGIIYVIFVLAFTISLLRNNFW